MLLHEIGQNTIINHCIDKFSNLVDVNITTVCSTAGTKNFIHIFRILKLIFQFLKLLFNIR